MQLPLMSESLVEGNDTKGTIDLTVYCEEIPSKRHHHYSWTDILKMNIIAIKEIPLHAQAIQKNSKLHLTAKIGVQKFSVNISDPAEINKFESSGFFFIDSDTMKNKFVKFSLRLVQGDDVHLIGQGKLNLNKILNNQEEDKDQIDKVILFEDAKINNKIVKLEIANLKTFTKLVSRESIENKLAESIFREYDYDFDGRLNKEETFDMLCTLHPKNDIHSTYSMIDSLFSKNKQFLNQTELTAFLTSTDVHSKPFLNLIVIASLRGRSFASTSNLMRGITYTNLANCPTINIKDRETDSIIKEKVPMYVLLALEAIKEKNPKIESFSSNLLERLTNKQGWYFDSKKSKSEIGPYIELHKIDFKTINNPIRCYNSFNDFFARSLSFSVRPLSDPKTEIICVSPADCRATFVPNILELKKDSFYSVKGHLNVNLRNLICNDKISSNFSNGSAVICRLATQDPHSWNSPVNGTQGLLFEIKGQMQSLHPFLEGKGKPDWNKRTVSQIFSKEFGEIAIIAIGGPMINSIENLTKPLQKIKRGDEVGKFKFGGSTLIVLFGKNRITFDEDLLKNSEKNIETKVKMRKRIGIATKPSFLKII